MANESQNLTNPNDVVDISLLSYFEGKIGNKYASQAGLDEVVAAVGTEASFEYVDLGLPSGTLWAKCNIGATVPEDHGKYFSRANVVGHEIGDGYSFTENNYQQTTGYSQYNKDIPLSADYDAAIALMDSDWQIPTIVQYQELYNNTTQEHTTINNVSGLLLTSTVVGYEDKSIFLPAGGLFISGSAQPYSLNTTGSYWARERVYAVGKFKGKCFDFDKTNIRYNYENEEYYGLNIRAVSVKIDPTSLSNRKADKATTLEGYGIVDTYTKTETDSIYAKKSDTYTKEEVDELTDGPLYDAEEKAIIFPDSYSVAFDPTTKSIVLT